MCHGPIFSKLLLFALPLMFSGLLQISFNAADMAVVGRFASHEALAAVGSTSSLFHLLINLFNGLAIGVNVALARYFGARDNVSVSKCTHTAIAISIYASLAMMVISFIFARPMLKLMGTPAQVLDKSCLYIWIIITGMPFVMLINFGSAILRAIGDTRRPLFFLIIAGIVNVLLNLFFVIVLQMSVAGVALATVISNILAAALVLRTLARENGPCRFSFRKMKINYPMLREIIFIGLPAGLQGCLFSIANITVQSSVNSFGSEAMAGVTASLTFDAMTYTICNSFHQTVISFCSQNIGGKTYHRLPRILLYSIGCSISMTAFMSIIGIVFSQPLLALFNTNPEVIRYGTIRLTVLLSTYSLCSLMEISTGGLRGIGHSTIPAISSLLTVCGFRLLWVFTIFPNFRSMQVLISCYPLSWLLNFLFCGSLLIFYLRRLLNNLPKSSNPSLTT